MSPPPAGDDTDLLEFTSATEGEGSFSAWELVPEKKIARKIGVKSDSELDPLVKKVAREEAEQRELTSIAAAAVTSSPGASSTTTKDLIATIPEDPAAEAAEAAGTKAEEEAADKPAVTSDATWQEADFSFEDAPAPPSKESLTSGMGRKNLIAVSDNPEGADSEMQDMEAPPMSHLGSSSKRKGRSSSQGAAKKRALPLKSPRSSSAGPQAKAAPAEKSANKIPRAASPQAKAVGKPAAKHPFGQSCCTERSTTCSHRKASTEQV